MKTHRIFTVAIAAFCALGASALADHKPGHPSRTTPMAPNQQAKSWDNQPRVVRTVGYPFVFLGRTGRTILRSPMILRDTFRGERKLVSKRGFFAREEQERPGSRVATAPQRSIANTRG